MAAEDAEKALDLALKAEVQVLLPLMVRRIGSSGDPKDLAVIIDAVTNEVIKTFDGVGKYPWSVTIPNGQNYCH